MDSLGINASTKSRWRAQSIVYLTRFNERTRKAVDHLRVFVSETGNDDSYFFMYAPMKMNIPFCKLTLQWKKTSFLIGDTSSHGGFPIAMLVYRSVDSSNSGALEDCFFLRVVEVKHLPGYLKGWMFR